MKKPNLDILTEEQKNKLSRDYEKFPLKRGEKIYAKDLKYLYLELNLSDQDLMSIFGKSLWYVQNCRYCYDIHRTKEETIQKRIQTNIKKYGVESPLKNNEIREKISQIIYERYGVYNVFQNSDIRSKYKETSRLKYGTDHPFQNKDVQEKYKETCKKNNDCEWSLSSFNIRQKIKETCLEKYGVENPSCNKTIREKQKQTCLERYGADNYTKSALYQGTNVAYKAYETKKENGTLSLSEQESLVFEKLRIKFFNIQNQYKCTRYPFLCDFYIPELDLFIELNTHWTHGPHPYQQELDTDLFNSWSIKAKTNKFYANAINTWTIRDPLKRETAKKNNLNWIEFFSMKEFDEWYNSTGGQNAED